jgi:hypothetical protein
MTPIVPTDTTSVQTTINTPIGELKYGAVYPTEETTEKLYNEIDFQRACQGYMWSMPRVTAACVRLRVPTLCAMSTVLGTGKTVPGALSPSSRTGQERQTTLGVDRHQRSAGQQENY